MWTGCASEALLKSFNGFVQYDKLIQYPLNQEQESLRQEYRGYFTHKVIPFIINVKDISPYEGLWKMKDNFLRQRLNNKNSERKY